MLGRQHAYVGLFAGSEDVSAASVHQIGVEWPRLAPRVLYDYFLLNGLTQLEHYFIGEAEFNDTHRHLRTHLAEGVARQNDLFKRRLCHDAGPIGVRDREHFRRF